MRWIFASDRGQNEVLGRNLSPLTCVSKVCFYALIIIIIFNDVVCRPFVQWTVKPFYFPPNIFFFSLSSFFFFLVNTNDIQLSDRSIAVGSPTAK